MNQGITFQTNIHFRCGRKGRRQLQSGTPIIPIQKGRVPRVARLMALAIKFDGLIRSGAVTDQAELARLGHVTRARITQVMNLLLLAPDIQEAILFLPLIEKGRDRIHLRCLQPIAQALEWGTQRQMWNELQSAIS